MIRRTVLLIELLRNEWRPRERLLAAQFARLQALVEHAWRHVPAYRAQWREHGLEPSLLREPSDLHRWPVIDKPTMRRLGTQAFIDERITDRDGLVRCSTSGSSGTPFEFLFSRVHDQWRKAQYLRPYLSTGRRLTDRLLRLTANPSTRPRAFQRLGLLRETQFDAGAPVGQVEAAWRALQPDVVQGYGSSLRPLALQAQARPLPLPRLLYTDSELLAPDCRRLLHDTFGTEPIDVFGSFETDNIAWQCERRGAYHVAIDCAVVEVLAADGTPLGPGDGEGDLVVTVLGNLAMPFIRYNLRDRASWVAGDCSCGRSLPLLDVATGRGDDLLSIGGESRSPMRLLGRFDRLGTAVAEYRVLQLAADELLVEVVPGPQWHAGLEQTVRAWVAQEDAALRARVAMVDSIPRAPSGKYKAFESRLGRPSA